MYYLGKTVVFILEDGEVRDEIERQIQKDELEFYHYVSKLVEEDISKKLGKRTYDESQIIETETKSLVSNQSPDPLSEIMDKLDLIISMRSISNVPNNSAVQNNYVHEAKPSPNESLAIEVPVQDIKEVPSSLSQVSEPSTSIKTKSKSKKKKIGLKGLDKGSLLSKMQSMQK